MTDLHSRKKKQQNNTHPKPLSNTEISLAHTGGIKVYFAWHKVDKHTVMPRTWFGWNPGVPS